MHFPCNGSVVNSKFSLEIKCITIVWMKSWLTLINYRVNDAKEIKCMFQDVPCIIAKNKIDKVDGIQHQHAKSLQAAVEDQSIVNWQISSNRKHITTPQTMQYDGAGTLTINLSNTIDFLNLWVTQRTLSPSCIFKSMKIKCRSLKSWWLGSLGFGRWGGIWIDDNPCLQNCAL